MTEPLWEPTQAQIDDANITRFRQYVNREAQKNLDDFRALHTLSVEEPEVFWRALWDWCGIIGEGDKERIVANPGKMPGTLFFPDARLNYAENLLRKRDGSDALVFWGEDKVRTRMSWAELYDASSQAQQVFAEMDLKPGDRVGAMLPNMPESIVLTAGATALGAIWSSCSPDFGERGVLDRFGQIEPRVLLVCDGYYYNGKKLDIGDKVEAIARQLPSVEKIIVVSYLGEADALAARLDNAVTYDAALGAYQPREMEFTRVGFNDPLFIMFSSGTTGAPKCIVHSVGGSLLQHVKEQRLHNNISPGDRVFYFSTMGWMMWNWLVSGLACEATLMLYDGSPFHPGPEILFDYAQDEKFTMFGTSAKYIDAVRKSGIKPMESHDLSSMRSMTSTGSPLSPDGFDFVYEGIKKDIHLGSMSGGTDICGCFVGPNPVLPLYSGEIQSEMLAMDMDVWDDDGKPLKLGKGELVCTSPFPSMPIMFWNDPDGEKYHKAYFDRFDNVWCHGDFAEWTEHHGMIIHGRSDATLNPGGVRIGTAEIYAQVEQMDEVLEAIAIGQSWDNDTRIVLFVRLAEGFELDDDLIARIKAKIRSGASPRHVPAKVLAVADIPRTKSGKITELAVRDIIHGREVKNKEALANPEALDLYRNLEELAR